jgi:hypothetical protein
MRSSARILSLCQFRETCFRQALYETLLEARKLKRFKILGLFVSVLGLSVAAHAQAIPTATGNSHPLQIGAGYSFAMPDYSDRNIGGGTVYGTYNIWHRIGVEGDIHFVTLDTPTDLGETTYLIGPRYMYQRKRIQAYAKFLAGIGQFQHQAGNIYIPQSQMTYSAIAIGGGVDVSVHKHINVRAFDFEAQKWLSFTPHTLSPYVFTFGVAFVR